MVDTGPVEGLLTDQHKVGNLRLYRRDGLDGIKEIRGLASGRTPLPLPQYHVLSVADSDERADCAKGKRVYGSLATVRGLKIPNESYWKERGGQFQLYIHLEAGQLHRPHDVG